MIELEFAFLGLILAYMVMGMVCCMCLWMLWQESLREVAAGERGLTEEELKKLEGTVGAGGGAECTVCLEEMVEGQVTRVLPGCHHSFHRPCADAWLQLRSVCPLCRAPLLPLTSQPKSQHQLPSS